MKIPKFSFFPGLVGAFALSALSAFADPIVHVPSEPEDVEVRDGLSITLSVTASTETPGKYLTYQWKKKPAGAGVAANVSDGGGISGSATANLKFTGAKADHAGSYFAEVTERDGSPALTVNSPDYILKVNVRPKIATTGQPAPATVLQGAGVTFAVTLTSDSTLEGVLYQWMKNNVDIPGAQESSYEIPAATVGNETTEGVQWADAGNYAVKINSTKTNTKITSKAAVLKVNSQPVILKQPSAETGGVLYVATKASGKTTVVAGGNPKLEYQWEKETSTPGIYADVTGAKAAALTVVGKEDESTEGNYRVRVKNTFTPSGSSGTYSAPVSVVVLNKPGETGTIAAVTNNPAQPNAKGEFEAKEVTEGVDTEVTLTVTPNVTNTGVLTFQWQKDGKNIANGDGVDGVTTAAIKFAPLKWVHRGVYRCVIKNGVGTFTSKPYTLKVNSKPVILTEPLADTFAVSGKPAVLSLVAGGTAAIKYQWYKVEEGDDTIQVKGKAAKYTISPAKDVNEGGYYCVVSNDFGSVTSQTTTLRVDVPVKISSVIMDPPKGPVVGSMLTLSIRAAEGDGPITVQWQRNNVNLVTGGRIAGATTTVGASSPALISLEISNVEFADAGSYRCIVTNAGGAVKVTSAAVKVNVLEAPSIITEPEDATAVEESTVSFAVVARGSPTLKYQWQKTASDTPDPDGADFANIAGNTTATKATLTLKNLTFADQVFYRCIVTNDSGVPAISNPVLLTVNGIPTATIDFVTPNKGMAGDKVRITGTNMQYVQEAYFGTPEAGAKVTLVKESSTSILLTVPPGLSTTTDVPISLKSKRGSVTSETPNVFVRVTEPVHDRLNPKIMVGTTFPITTGRTYQGLNLGQLPNSGGLAECFYTWVAPKAGTYKIGVNSTFRVFMEVILPTKSIFFNSDPGVTGGNADILIPDANTAVGIRIYGESLISDPYGLQNYGTFLLRVNNPIGASPPAPPSAANAWGIEGNSASIQQFSAEDGSAAATFTGSSSQGGQPTVIWKDSSDLVVKADSVVRTEWTMDVDKAGTGAAGHFAWQVAGAGGAPLGQLQVSVSDGKLYAVEADGSRTELAPQLMPGSSHRFEITTDLGEATWQVRMDGAAVSDPLPLPANNGFGDVSVIWYPASSGARPTMTFDDVSVTVE